MAKNTLENCKSSKPISVLSIHGTKDKVIPYHGGDMPIGLKGKVASTKEVLEQWRKHNQCSRKIFSNKLENTAKDWTRTTLQEFQRCKKAKVVHYKISNGGHTWPGSPVHQPVILQGLTSKDFNASLHIWRFFQSLERLN